MAYEPKDDTSIQLLIAQSPLGQQTILGGMLLSDLVATAALHAIIRQRDSIYVERAVVEEAFDVADEYLSQRAERISAANAAASVNQGH